MNYYTLSDIDDATVANVASRYRFFASYCSTAYLLCFLLTVIGCTTSNTQSFEPGTNWRPLDRATV